MVIACSGLISARTAAASSAWMRSGKVVRAATHAARDGGGLLLEAPDLRRSRWRHAAAPIIMGRRLAAQGHDSSTDVAEYVRPYVKAQKNDDRDAEAIAEAATRPTMRFVELEVGGATRHADAPSGARQAGRRTNVADEPDPQPPAGARSSWCRRAARSWRSRLAELLDERETRLSAADSCSDRGHATTMGGARSSGSRAFDAEFAAAGKAQ